MLLLKKVLRKIKRIIFKPKNGLQYDRTAIFNHPSSPHLVIVNFDTDLRLVCSAYDIRHKLITRHRQDHKIHFLMDVCNLNSISYFIDIGANYGEFSLKLAPLVSKVISFEPNPIISSCLIDSVNINGFKNVIVKTAAIYDESGLIKIQIDPFYSGGSTVKEERFVSGNNDKPTFFIQTEAFSASALFELIGTNKNFIIKIDAEGADINILESLAVHGLFKANNVLVMCEYSFSGSDFLNRFSNLINEYLANEFLVCSLPENRDVYQRENLQLFSSINKLNLNQNQELIFVKGLKIM